MVLRNPTIIELDMGKLDDLLERVDARELRVEDYSTIQSLIESYKDLYFAVGDKNTSIARLRKLLFGAKTEKTANVVEQRRPEGIQDAAHAALPAGDASAGEDAPKAGSASDASPEARNDSATASLPEPGPAPKRHSGHGRNGADAYTAAEKIEVPHPSLQPGDPCPKCETGTVYETNRPGVVVRLVGQAPVGAKVYYLQKLRCNLCGVVFAPDLPPGAGEEKCDATVGSMIALLRYGTGMPMNRNETLQEGLGIPLPASTQWDIVADQAERAEPVFEELVRHAAQGDVLYNDDTTVKILAMMDRQALAEESAGEQAEDSAEIVADATGTAAGYSGHPLAGRGSACESRSAAEKPEAQRKGMFTTGIVAEIGGGEKIALFLSGHQHAGENLKDVLIRRAADLPPPIQMCDALSRNLPRGLKTILGNCLAHGRRKFVDVAERFPEECLHVLELLAVVYHNDALAKERNLSPAERLLLHQADSGPVMEELHTWLGRQFDEHRVEPNSALGAGIAYMRRHWQELTLFLRVAGAPLDNNICERVLKMAIRHRKNSLFYKTPRGAHVGDIFMSLIHTCRLCGANPFDYLTELERHADQAAINPADWMPWNYQQALAGAAASSAAP
jgi:transposase